MEADVEAGQEEKDGEAKTEAFGPDEDELEG